MLSKFDNTNVIYIAYIGNYNNKNMYKYGKSTNIYNREFLSHRKKFEKFDMVNIYKTNFKDEVESSFKKELKIRDIYSPMIIGNKKYTELFFETPEYNLKYINRLIELLIQDYEEKQYHESLLVKQKLRIKELQYIYNIKKLELELKKL